MCAQENKVNAGVNLRIEHLFQNKNRITKSVDVSVKNECSIGYVKNIMLGILHMRL